VSGQSPHPGRRWLGRVFDLLAIATVAVAILWIAWMSTRGQKAPAPPNMPALPELDLQLPIAREGMLLSKVSVRGDRRQALEQLQRMCWDVVEQQAVLPLEIDDEERRLLAYCTPDSRVTAPPAGSPLPPGEGLGVRDFAQPVPTTDQPINSSAGPMVINHAIYRQPQDEGLIAVRETVLSTSTPAVANPHPQHLSQRERGAGTEDQRPAGDPSAVIGRRVVCWGFVVSDGASGHSIWFARPALSLPTASLEGSAP
jgi:hypothetical protein